VAQVQLGFTVALAVALVVVVAQVRRTRGLRRRLLVMVTASALLPAAGAALVTLGSAREMLAVLDAPGLRSAMEGGLGLARALIEREQALVGAWADSLASRSDPRAVDLPSGFGWQRIDADGRLLGSGGDLAGFTVESEPVIAAERVRRARVGEDMALVLERAVGGERLVVVRVLPTAVARDLARVEEGSLGLRQLGLYYRELLGTWVLVLAVSALILVAVLTAWAGRVASERLVVPLADLVAGTSRVAAGDLQHRVRVHGVGEVSELAEAFNTMTERLAASEERRLRSERLAAWQGIARRLAHEIKNPLTPIQLAVHRVRRRESDAVTLEALEAIEQETQNLQRLAEEFSSLGRLPRPQPRAVSLRRVLEEVVALYVPDTVTLQWEGDAHPVVHADPGQLRQVLANLVKNAVEATARSGSLQLHFEQERSHCARLSIRDDGPGLPAPRERIFDPGFTTRPTGSGLGLAIVQRIVEDHGATITAEDAPGGGACFRLSWPLAPASREESNP
jgi:nitrogen fixation/metabolism regulation signal transduction histidine kinase